MSSSFLDLLAPDPEPHYRGRGPGTCTNVLSAMAAILLEKLRTAR